MKFVKIVSVMFLSLSASAFADDTVQGTGLYIEPGITYQLTESNVDYSTGTGLGNSTATTRGFGVVARGGIHLYERFFVAVDARYARLKYRDNANNISVAANSWDLAPVVGIQMADYGVRLYGGYILAGFLDPEAERGFDTKLEEPSGWRVGAGLKLQSFSVNIEWQRIHYGKSELQYTGGATPGHIDYNGDGIVASVTFPIEFN